jgi:O-antigen polysaccharide polymerase Wzy
MMLRASVSTIVTRYRSARRQALPRTLAALAAASGAVALVLALALPGTAAAYAAASAQTIGVAWLAARGLASPRGWMTATSVTAAAWVVLFVVPSWIYAIDPEVLLVDGGSEALLVVNVSLYALLLGWELPMWNDGDRVAARIRVTLRPLQVSLVRVSVCFVVSAACLIVLFAVNEGPVNYLWNLDQSAQQTAGLTYLFWGILGAKFATFTYVAVKWARDEPLERLSIALLVGAFVLVALQGSRGPVVIGLVELALIRVLVWRKIRIRALAAAIAAVLIVVVFGFGSIKRYQGYDAAHPREHIGYTDYVVNVAPGDSVSAYVTNYADQLRLIAITLDVVPEQASYERGRIFERLVLQPIPRPFRPDVPRDPDLAEKLYPTPSLAYAIPLQADAYIQFGTVGVVLCFVLLGAGLRALDRWFGSEESWPTRRLLGAIGVVVAIPLVIRSGLQGGVIFGLLEIVGFWVVATFVDATWSPRRRIAVLGRRSLVDREPGTR